MGLLGAFYFIISWRRMIVSNPTDGGIMLELLSSRPSGEKKSTLDELGGVIKVTSRHPSSQIE